MNKVKLLIEVEAEYPNSMTEKEQLEDLHETTCYILNNATCPLPVRFTYGRA